MDGGDSIKVCERGAVVVVPLRPSGFLEAPGFWCARIFVTVAEALGDVTVIARDNIWPVSTKY